MFTAGFKFFFGLAMAAVGAAVVYAFFGGDTSTGPDYFGVLDRETFKGIISLGWRGNVGGSILGYVLFLTLASVAAFLGFTMNAYRDADATSVAELEPDGVLPPSQAPTTTSFWPLASALGLGMIMVGLATSPIVWQLGLGVLGIVIFEWAITAWADRMTGDREKNLAIRNRLMGPIEVPLLAVAGLGVLAVAVSRILLAVSHMGAVIAAGVIALVIFAIALVFVNSPKMGKAAVGGILGIAMVGIIAAGVVSAAQGEYYDEDYYNQHHGDEDDHSEEDGEALAGLGE